MATKKTAKKTAKKSAKKTGAKKAALALTTTGDCLSLGRAGTIVQDAIPGGPHPIDLTLEQVGLISDNQRTIFREDVFDAVLEGGCHIDRDDIPNDGTNTIRQVRDAVKDAAS